MKFEPKIFCIPKNMHSRTLMPSDTICSALGSLWFKASACSYDFENGVRILFMVAIRLPASEFLDPFLKCPVVFLEKIFERKLCKHTTSHINFLPAFNHCAQTKYPLSVRKEFETYTVDSSVYPEDNFFFTMQEWPLSQQQTSWKYIESERAQKIPADILASFTFVNPKYDWINAAVTKRFHNEPENVEIF